MFEVIGCHCDFCSESSFNRTEIERHEKLCSFNPINRTCNSCKHFGANMSNWYGGKNTCIKLGLYFIYRILTDCDSWELLDE